jgi:hypothetical protein
MTASTNAWQKMRKEDPPPPTSLCPTPFPIRHLFIHRPPPHPPPPVASPPPRPSDPHSRSVGRSVRQPQSMHFLHFNTFRWKIMITSYISFFEVGLGTNLPYNAMTQYRKFEANIPRKGIALPQSQFTHSCVCERFIYSHLRSANSAAEKYVGRSLE